MLGKFLMPRTARRIANMPGNSLIRRTIKRMTPVSRRLAAVKKRAGRRWQNPLSYFLKDIINPFPSIARKMRNKFVKKSTIMKGVVVRRQKIRGRQQRFNNRVDTLLQRKGYN